MTSKLEDVALAIEDALAGHVDVILGVGPNAAMDAARAAIEALRKPSMGILQEAQASLGFGDEFIDGGGNFKFCTNDLGEINAALIDALLNEKPGGGE